MPADLHTCDAVDGREAVDQIAFGIVGQLKRRALVAGEAHPENGFFRRVGLLHIWRIGFLGQLAEHAANPVADVIGRGIHVPGDVELDRDDRLAVLAERVDVTDAFDAGDAVFDHFGDARLDHVGGRTCIGGANGNNGRIDVGIFAQGEAREGHDAHGHQQEADDGGEHGSFDRDVRKQHGADLPAL